MFKRNQKRLEDFQKKKKNQVEDVKVGYHCHFCLGKTLGIKSRPSYDNVHISCFNSLGFDLITPPINIRKPPPKFFFLGLFLTSFWVVTCFTFLACLGKYSKCALEMSSNS